MNDERLQIFYFQVTDLCQRLCEMHSELYDLTCIEYSYLLKNDIDRLNLSVQKKQMLINEINGLEQMRQELVVEANESNPDKKINGVADLIKWMQSLTIEKQEHHLERFNRLLIDIIEQIQAQNKKNQMFINKALVTLKEIREEATGTKGYSTYTMSGATTKSTNHLSMRR